MRPPRPRPASSSSGPELRCRRRARARRLRAPGPARRRGRAGPARGPRALRREPRARTGHNAFPAQRRSSAGARSAAASPATAGSISQPTGWSRPDELDTAPACLLHCRPWANLSAMASRALQRMTLAEFLDWDDGSDRRHQLVDGIPTMMAPALEAHGELAISIGAETKPPPAALPGDRRGGHHDPGSAGYVLCGRPRDHLRTARAGTAHRRPAGSSRRGALTLDRPGRSLAQVADTGPCRRPWRSSWPSPTSAGSSCSGAPPTAGGSRT